MIIQGHTAGDPAICNIAAREPIEMTRRANSIDGCVKPQGKQNRRIRRGTTRLPLSGFDGLVKGRKIKALDKTPYNASPMLGREQALQIDEIPSGLRSICLYKPCFARHLNRSRCTEVNHSGSPKPIFSRPRRRPSSIQCTRDNALVQTEASVLTGSPACAGDDSEES